MTSSVSRSPARRITQTVGWNTQVNTNAPGSVTIAAGQYAYWTGIQVLPFHPFSGMTVYKAGRLTGITGGTVAGTCVDAEIDFEGGGQGKVLCFVEAEGASFGPGDSGGPIFYPAAGGDPPYAIGIQSSGHREAFDGEGRCTAGCTIRFTPWSNLEFRLAGTFSPTATSYVASISGPAAINDYAIACSWTATTDVLYPQYSWTADGVPVGTGQTLIYAAASDFTLQVTISNSWGHGASASLNVDVSPSHPAC